MDLKTLWENFDVIAEAENGIQRLRDLILELAIRGKLVPQSETETTSENLLNCLPALREEKLSQGLLKKTRHPKGIKVENPPHEIPRNWCWRHLGDVGEIIGGGTPKSGKPKYWSDQKEIPWITPADMTKQESRYIVRGKRDITQEGLNNSSAQLMPAGTVLFSSRAPIGHVGIAANPISTNQGFKSCSPYHDEMSEYIYLYLRYAGKKVNEQATGTTFKEVSGKDVALIPIPIPPLEEQNRIVEKVDELMELCDRAQASKENRNELQQQLRQSAIHALETAETEEEFNESWHFVRDNFSAIVQSSQDAYGFNKFILDLAVRGKLTVHNSNDESVINVLSKIKRNEKVLAQNNRQQSKRNEASVKTKEVPFKIPNHWRWVNLSEVCLKITDGEHLTPNYSDDGVPILSAKHIGKRSLIWNDYKLVTEENAQQCWERCFPEKGDILIVSRGGGIGRVILSDNDNYCLMGSVLLLKPSKYIINEFLLYYLSSSTGNETLKRTSSATAQQAIYITHLKRNYLIPLPPIEEQKRIVTKVNELMKICDRVEENLSKKEELANAISASVIHHLEL